MTIEAKVLLDSVAAGKRVTTMQLTYPRMVHAEYMTHRVFSRNAASSRAIPVTKLIKRVMDDPVIPIHWGKNQAGMQAYSEVEEKAECERLWLDAMTDVVDVVEQLIELGLHKQIANRLLEPWMHITVIHTATDWHNFFRLRCHSAAEPHMHALADAMQEAYAWSEPMERYWHAPLTGFDGDETLTEEETLLVSVARCARVSYLTHDGTRDVQKDLELAERLRTNGHLSPWEHVCHALPGRHANFSGWEQLRWYVERDLSFLS